MTDVLHAETLRVETKSAWLSKINWTQAVAVTANLLVLTTGGKFDIPPEVQAQIVVGIGAVQGLATWIFKTWFTPTITPASQAMSGQKTMTLD